LSGFYVDGYRNGCNIESWAADTFVSGNYALHVNKKLSLKDLKNIGFNPWLGKSPQSDYYIIRDYSK
jgi:hypothetical protein